MKYEILPLRTAFLWIAAATLLVSGSAAAGIWLYKWHQRLAATDEKYVIAVIQQNAAGTPPLEAAYLEELLELAADRPTFLTTYNTRRAEEALLASPFITRASVKKVAPATLQIDYSLRRAAALLSEYGNVAVDDKGVAFPVRSGMELADCPLIRLGAVDGEVEWNVPLKSRVLPLGLQLAGEWAACCRKQGVVLVEVDVSRVEAPSAGQREIVATFREASGSPLTYYLRMGIDHCSKDLANFWVLREFLQRRHPEMLQGGLSVDLRVPQLAFLSPVK